jgi:hypothetical protein
MSCGPSRPHCGNLDKAKNTFTGAEGTSSLSGDATGFFTPAR